MTFSAHRQEIPGAEEPEPWPRGVSRKPLLSIGQVVSRLEQEFPAISLSKVRFLEERGIVTPFRTASMYRKFSEADIERLRFCLTAQRESFLPLDQIKDRLDRMDAGEEVAVEPVARVVASAGVPVQPVDGSVITLRELEDYTSATDEELETLIDCGLIQPDQRGRYPASAVRVVRQALALRAGGVPLRSMKMIGTFAHRMSHAALSSSVVQKGSSSVIAERRRAQSQDIARVASELVQEIMRADIDRDL
ncbi:MerR family transcriptional regulator [Boudabousia marimammalium]|uniref:HTH merR-type domain-containing protein n=1 Tax=Boudabousia marimammalium TaxID=156892 RepID=A0A1Q5PQR7_9ACTO|nr:MerR family transcriptional regulator [Boudabousia marimammalium]OKL49988.1 hypothetical protein BM477_03585 [Boudabousia marimammalium]